MAELRIYCDCKVREIGTARLDAYKLRRPYFDLITEGKPLPCRHCGAHLKEVGEEGALTEREANRIDKKLTPNAELSGVFGGATDKRIKERNGG